MKHHGFLLASLVLAVAGPAQLSRAQLLLTDPTMLVPPEINFDGTGSCLTITPNGGGTGVSTFVLSADPTDIDGIDILPDGAEGKGLSITFNVLEDGSLDGSDPTPAVLVLTGAVAGLSGVLLTGELNAFGFSPSPSFTNVFDMQFSVTGGKLADLFGDLDLYVLVEESKRKETCESTTLNTDFPFDGTFSSFFRGNAKGFMAGIPGLGGGNGEPPGGVGGCTPGYWKQEQHFDSWAVFGTEELFTEVFDVEFTSCETVFDGLTLLDALKQGGGKEKALGRHAVAALLNAAALGNGFAFPTVDEVIAAVEAACASGDKDVIEAAKNAFVIANEAGCPLN